MNLPTLEAGIRTLTQTYEINRIIEVLKAQQRIVRLMEASKKKYSLSVGSIVQATSRKGTIKGEITKINRTKAIVRCYGGEQYNVPLSMLEPAIREAV